MRPALIAVAIPLCPALASPTPELGKLSAGDPSENALFADTCDLRGPLAIFGAKIHKSAKIRRTARIDCPWNLTMGELSALGDHARIIARAPVHVGSSCTLSQYTKILTRAHDPLDPDYQIYTAPVTIHDDAWIAADVVVMPGVTVGEGVVVGARSFVDRSIEPWKIAAGEPALPRRPRPFLGRPSDEPESAAA